jgi:hypothetical protein
VLDHITVTAVASDGFIFPNMLSAFLALEQLNMLLLVRIEHGERRAQQRDRTLGTGRPDT